MKGFDTVIVGAGSAGCVLAARLSEDPGCRVLLLEAGGPDSLREIRVPAAFGKLFRSPVDWNYSTEEQPHLEVRTLYWPRGKVLGGCSSINAMVYIRGHRSDYDGWAALGNEGWSFAKVLPYFKKSENQQRGASEYHGVGGPLDVADLRCINPLSPLFLEACAEAGLQHNDDFNGPNQDGAGFYQVTQKDGRRASTTSAYLAPARRHSNLSVVTRALATRILFEQTRAVGVEYVHDGKRCRAQAGQVILSGGAVNSPHLLLLSGVGPQEQVKKCNLPVVVDLPGVGQNLQDHPLSGVTFSCTQPVTLDRAGTLLNTLKFLLLRRGPLTSNIAEAGAFVRSESGLPAPDLQLYFVPAFYIEHGFVRPDGCGFSLGACVLRPRSRGSIVLRSADPATPPAIQPRYLDDPHDLSVMVRGIELLRQIAGGKALAPFRGEEILPGAQGARPSPEEVASYIRTNLQTLYHPVGTCKMGSDPEAVVDAQLRVHGTEGLRVVDASVMPTLVGGNTNAPVIMIAEKVASEDDRVTR